MKPYAALRGVAATLLIHYLYLGGENESIEDTMAALGLTNRNYFYRARGELHRLGLLTRDGKLTGQPVANYAEQSVAFDPKPLLPEGAILLDFGSPVSTSPLSQAAEIDRMDASGDIRKPTSPAQARRRAQVIFLQEQGERLFPGKFLSDKRAKELLALADESAEIVLGALEGIPDTIEYPYGYADKVLRGDGTSRVRSVPGPLKPTSLEPDVAPREPDYYMTKWSPRTAKVMERLEALGKLKDEGDDW